MKHKINVSGIQLYAFHGCLDEEAKIGGKYEVDVRIDTYALYDCLISLENGVATAFY